MIPPRGWPRPLRAAALLATLAALVSAAGAWHRRELDESFGERSRAELQSRLAAVQARCVALARQLREAADQAAVLPAAREALRGDRASLPGLFRALETLGSGRGDPPAVAIHSVPFATLAWARPTADIRGLEDTVGLGRKVFVVAGSVTTTLMAAAPVSSAAGRVVGLATAEAPVRVRRNIQNQYLRDFDLLEGSDELVEVHYADVRDEGPAPFPAAAPGEQVLSAQLRGPAGELLGEARARAPSLDRGSRPQADGYRQVVALLLALAVVSAGFVGSGPRLLRVGLVATALRLLLGWLGSPSIPIGALRPDPEAYGAPFLGPLLATPLDLLLTATWALLLAALLCSMALRMAPSASAPLGTLVGSVACLPLIVLAFAFVRDAVVRSPLDMDNIGLFPRSLTHLVLKVSLLLVLATTALLLVALLSMGGPLPSTAVGRLKRAAFWTLLGAAGYALWPRPLLGLPLVPTLGLLLLAALLAGTPARWRPWLENARPEPLAGLGVVVAFVLSVLLYPTIVHFDERNLRDRIEGEDASLVRHQTAWREEKLRSARGRIDSMDVLEEPPDGAPASGTDELAFSIWSATALAESGIASAVELQDRAGSVVGRFALNLAAPRGAWATSGLPREDEWRVTRERFTVASAERHVLHARRRLVYHGEVHGAIHLYMADDPWDLPFLPERDPYVGLYRTSPGGRLREPGVDLVVFGAGRNLVYSSAERPPTLGPDLIERLAREQHGFWVTLGIDGRPHQTFLFADGAETYGLAYPRLGIGAFAAGLLEAGSGSGLLALVAVALVVLFRTALGRPTLSVGSLVRAVRSRFALRLFVAFVSAAILPVAVLGVLFRGYVADRLHHESEDEALDRAGVAQRAIDDFSFYQRGEGPGRPAVNDAVLVWVARLIRGDVDVFGRGRLLASSKRELFSSGLLASSVSGLVFRSLILDGAPALLRTERIGRFATLVAYVPVRLDGPEPGILSLPLAVREREVQATLEDLDRSIRLASLGFLGLAAALALSMSRRISGPIRDLTRATRRVAQGDLAARVTTTSRDELQGLVESFNTMAGELARQRADLERSNRLAAWAEMARQVAHEIKNPLTPIQLSAEHLLRVWQDGVQDFGATLSTCTETILKQVRTLRGIVTEFSAFARPPAAKLELEDLSRIVAEAVRPYTAGLPPGVSLALETPAGLPLARLDRRLVARAVVNLVENALQAVGERGRLVIRVGLEPRTDELLVEVEDDGPGLTPEARARIFDPFFSTKTSGSGLGLAIVKKIAEDHGGRASVTSEPGAPTRARLVFPAGPGLPASATAGADAQ